MIRHMLLLCSVVLWTCWLTHAQATPSSPSSEAPAEASLPYSEVLMPPMPVAGVRAPLSLASEPARTNLVRGSVGITAAYDDNMLSTTSNRTSDTSYLVFPTLDFVQSRERWLLDLNYSPGFTFNQKLSERNQATHDLHLLLGYRLSPHVNLQLRDSFVKTTTLFSDFAGMKTAGPGPMPAPNVSPVTPVTERTGNTSGLDLTYQFGRDSMVGASGGYYFVNYGRVEGTSGQPYRLVDTRSWNGDGFYAHRFGGRHWLGTSYTAQRLMFNPGFPTDVQRVLGFYSLYVGSHMSFSVWAGPERSNSRAPFEVVARAPQWNVAGGLQWSWQGQRTAFSAGYTRQTSDGGGLAQAVLMNLANAEVQRQLTRRWNAVIQTMYVRDDGLNPSGIQAQRSLSASADLRCQMTQQMGFALRYARYQQEYALHNVPANRNRASVSIYYSFSRPVGR